MEKDWAVSQGVLNGKAIFIRYRDSLHGSVDQAGKSFQIGVAVPLIEPTSEGLPSNQEAKVLAQIEDELEKVLSENNQCVLVLIITTNGMREFVFYAAEWKPEFFEARVKSINNLSHELQFMMQPDKEWETYNRFVK